MNSVTIIETPTTSMADYYKIHSWTRHNCPSFFGVKIAPDKDKFQWKFNSEPDAMFFALKWST